MSTACFSGAFPAGRPLMPADRFADVAHYIQLAAPNSIAAAYIDPRYEGRLRPCADATWCAQEIVSGRNDSVEVGDAAAAYVEKFSHEAYMNFESLTSLTAITTLGSNAMRRAVLDNEMGTEVAKRLRSAASLGLPAQRHAAAEVLSRYALQAAAERCDGSLLLSAMSALRDVISALRDYRPQLELGQNYDRLMIGTLRSLASVSRYVGENTISLETVNLLRKVIRMDEVGVIRDGAMKAAAVVSAEPQQLNCGPVKAFGPFTDHPLLEKLMT